MKSGCFQKAIGIGSYGWQFGAIWFVLLSVFVTLASVSAIAQAKTGDELAVVVHPSTPVNGLSMDEVRQVFRGDKQYWNSNMPVVLLVRAPVAEERELVLKVIYRMSEGKFKQYWVSKIFRAEATSGPKIVFSNTMAGQLVAAVPGAIAFINAKEVPPGLKVLPIDGRLPGQPGYPLRFTP
jgi:hypothetical protein